MKRTQFVAALLGLVYSATLYSSYADGYVVFSSYQANAYGGPDPVTTFNGTPLDSSYQAGLYYALGTVSDPVDLVTTAPIGLAALGSFVTYSYGYFDGSVIDIPGYTNGPITFEVVAFNSSSFAGSNFRGRSGSFTMNSISTSATEPSYFGDNGTPMPNFYVDRVPDPPIIIDQPTSQTAVIGGTATFSILAKCDTYLWYFNGLPLNNATSSILTITNVQEANLGNYYCVVTTTTYPGILPVISSVVSLNIASSPSLINQPQSSLVNAYNSAVFSVTASGSIPFSYQWTLNNSNIWGATNSSLAISNVTQTDLGDYAVLVTNSYGIIISSNATLSMYPFIETPFTGAITFWGQPATLGLGAWGTGPLSYQWFDNGVAVPNATNSILNFANIQFTNAGLYSVVVTSPLGAATNAPAQVVVNPAEVSLGFSPTLTINGTAGYSYIIQSTTNLANTNAWVTLTNLTLMQPIQTFIDTSVDASSPFNPKTFYKILPGP